MLEIITKVKMLLMLPRLFTPYVSAYNALPVVGFAPAEIPVRNQNMTAAAGWLNNISTHKPTAMGISIKGKIFLAEKRSMAGPVKTEKTREEMA